jgi:hypothetical protein
MRIRIEIDQLVLYGVNNKHDADHIEQAIENELADLIAKDGIKNNKVIKRRDEESIERMNGGSFSLRSGHTISKLAGASIAKSIYSVMDSKQ